LGSYMSGRELQYEGAKWDVVVWVRQTEDARLTAGLCRAAYFATLVLKALGLYEIVSYILGASVPQVPQAAC
jgi:hypothetical protein